MKKLILSIVVLFAVSCSEKEEGSVCYRCTTITKTSVNVPTPGYPQTTTMTFETCNGDQSGQNTSTVSQGGITATSVATTTCVRK